MVFAKTVKELFGVGVFVFEKCALDFESAGVSCEIAFDAEYAMTRYDYRYRIFVTGATYSSGGLWPSDHVCYVSVADDFSKRDFCKRCPDEFLKRSSLGQKSDRKIFS